MKETLDEQSRISLTRYRMDRADEARSKYRGSGAGEKQKARM